MLFGIDLYSTGIYSNNSKVKKYWDEVCNGKDNWSLQPKYESSYNGIQQDESDWSKITPEDGTIERCK